MTIFASESIHEFVEAFLDEACGGGFGEVESGTGEGADDGGERQAGALTTVFVLVGCVAGAFSGDDGAGGDEAAEGGEGQPADGVGGDGLLEAGGGIEAFAKLEGSGREGASGFVEVLAKCMGGHRGA